LLLYSHIISPRLQYIADFIGKEILDEPLQVTVDKDVFKRSAEPKINYSNEKIATEEYWLQPHSLLFENDIKQQPVKCFDTNGKKAFFKTGGDFPFDIFSASFYLLSRYEEYLPHQKDMYGRYAHENSLACKENFLHLPLINLWGKDFIESLKQKFSLFTVHNFPFIFLPTYDIDEAYSYKHKSWWRSAGGTGKAILKGEWAKIKERRKVLTGKMQDPYDAYYWMNNLHEKYNLKPRYFFLVPDKTGKYDKNILPKEKKLQQLIRQHADQYTIGIHPSWQSGDDPALIKKEIETVENITGKKITSSRQHYIRFVLPQTFRYLINAGIKEDFSMGYGSINGFRASVASPFYWYDLGKEKTTGLLLHPFCFMDANSFYEQKFSAQQVLNEMLHYYKAVKSVNGTFISIWHNTFLGTGELFTRWKDAYEQFIIEVS
jgi:Family of unknown function (DUF7033)